MKFSFSTKGWHGVNWNTFVETAADLSFDGIEIHNLFSPAMAEKGCPADKQAGAATYRALFDRKLSIPCINTTADIADAAAYDRITAEIDDCIEAAVRLKAPYVRLHTTLNKDACSEEAVRKVLAYALPKAESSHVVLLIETIHCLSSGVVRNQFVGLCKVQDLNEHCAALADRRLRLVQAKKVGVKLGYIWRVAWCRTVSTRS